MKLKSWRAERGELTVNTPSCLCLSLNGSEGFSSSCHALLCWCCHYGEMENGGVKRRRAELQTVNSWSSAGFSLL